MRSLRQKLALVTGSGSGIGRAIAMALACEGANLFLVDIDPQGLATAADEAQMLGVHVSTYVTDIGRPREVEQLVDALLARWAGLDILVNNAGIAFYGLTEQMTDQQWDRVLAVNLHGPILLARRLLPALLARGEAHIVNVCSLAGLVAAPRLTAYQVSKSGLVGFSESLRAEYGGRGLGVTALCPGLVRTNIFEAAGTTPGRSVPRFPRWLYTSPERVARRAIRAIRRDQGVVGVTVLDHLVWGIKRFAPGLLDFVQRFRWRAHRAPAATPLVELPEATLALDAAAHEAKLLQNLIPFEAPSRRRAARAVDAGCNLTRTARPAAGLR
jgi:short-subunit dehydrogenase